MVGCNEDMYTGRIEMIEIGDEDLFASRDWSYSTDGVCQKLEITSVLAIGETAVRVILRQMTT